MRRYTTFDHVIEIVPSLCVVGRRTDNGVTIGSVHSAELASRNKGNELRRRLSGLNMAEVQAETERTVEDPGDFEATVFVILRVRVRGTINKDTGAVRIETVQGDERGAQTGDGLLRVLGPDVVEQVRESIAGKRITATFGPPQYQSRVTT